MRIRPLTVDMRLEYFANFKISVISRDSQNTTKIETIAKNTHYAVLTYGLSIGHTTISLMVFLANSRPAISSQDNCGPWSII